MLETIENTECVKLTHSSSSNGTDLVDQNCPTNTRDYHRELNKDFLRGDKGFLRQAKKTAVIFEKNVKKVCKEEELDAELCLDVLRYYFRQYLYNVGKEHPHLNNENLKKCCIKINLGTDVVFDMDSEAWEVLIDQHFKTDYGVNQDWNINFFLCDDVLNNRYYETLY